MLSSARGPETRGMGKRGWAECAAEVNVGDQGSPWRLGTRTAHRANVPESELGLLMDSLINPHRVVCTHFIEQETEVQRG